MLYINGISLEDVNNKSLFAVEFEDGYGRYWTTYTGAEIGEALKGRDDISDVDLVWWEGQPKELMPFYKWFAKKDRELVGMSFSQIFEKYGSERR